VKLVPCGHNIVKIAILYQEVAVVSWSGYSRVSCIERTARHERTDAIMSTQQQPSTTEQETALQNEWHSNPRWAGVKRDYTAGDVIRLRGSVQEEHTLARRGSEQLWDKLHTEDYINALGALTGNQAVQQVKAGLKAVYLSGWQVAGDANLAGQTYPDQSLYPAN